MIKVAPTDRAAPEAALPEDSVITIPGEANVVAQTSAGGVWLVDGASAKVSMW